MTVVPPEEGRLAGGDSGSGRLAEPSVIVDTVLAMLGPTAVAVRPVVRRDLPGSGWWSRPGGTREPIDPVRFITNRSSGKQGHAVAAAARRRGAEVVLVTASPQPVPDGVAVDRVETAADMEAAMLARAGRPTWWSWPPRWPTSAPRWPPARNCARPTGCPTWSSRPRRTSWPSWAGGAGSGQVLVGFAAETDAVAERAMAKLQAKGVDLMVANDVTAPGAGFDHDTNAVTIFGADGSTTTVALRYQGRRGRRHIG